MNENGLSSKLAPAKLAGHLAIGIFCWLAAGSQTAEGAVARRYALTPGQARVYTVWSNFLAQGPEVWATSRTPPFTPQIKSTIWQILRNDTVEEQLANPMINYLLWRQSLNPTRFTAYHPNLSPALSQLLEAAQQPATLPAPSTTVPETTVPETINPQEITPPSILIPPSSQSVSPQNVNPPAVPEPGSLILATGMLGWGLWWRRRIQHAGAR